MKKKMQIVIARNKAAASEYRATLAPVAQQQTLEMRVLLVVGRKSRILLIEKRMLQWML
jgi:hypothetical protein